jgi:hypothetical protein
MNDLMDTTMMLIESEQRNVKLQKQIETMQKIAILGELKTNLSANKRNKLLREYNALTTKNK